MPVNQITLDKIEPVTIRQMENKVVDRIVHEIKGTEIQKENKSKNEYSFNEDKQEKLAKEFSFFLSKFNIKLEYKVLKNKVKVKIKDKDDNLLIETEVDDIENLLDSLKRETGNILDVRG